MSGGNLVLRGVGRTAAGSYACSVSNVEGDARSSPVMLQVMCEYVFLPLKNKQLNIVVHKDLFWDHYFIYLLMMYCHPAGFLTFSETIIKTNPYFLKLVLIVLKTFSFSGNLFVYDGY